MPPGPRYWRMFVRCSRYSLKPSTVCHCLVRLRWKWTHDFSITCVDKEPDIQVESGAISAFRELVVKLNDAAFRPLFRRLYDWAFADDNGASQPCTIPPGTLDIYSQQSPACGGSPSATYTSDFSTSLRSNNNPSPTGPCWLQMITGFDEPIHVIFIATVRGPYEGILHFCSGWYIILDLYHRGPYQKSQFWRWMYVQPPPGIVV